MILEELVIASLKAGKIFPSSKCTYGYARPCLDIMLALNHKMLPNAKRLLYSENTFIIADGGVQKVGFLYKMHDADRQLIRSVEIAFTYADNISWLVEHSHTSRVPNTNSAEGEGESEIRLAIQASPPTGFRTLLRQTLQMDATQVYQPTDSDAWLLETRQIWQAKVKFISGLRLDTLSLDFSGTYVCDNIPTGGMGRRGRGRGRDMSVGMTIAILDFPLFEHGIPANLRIAAPDPNDACGIGNILRARNSQEGTDGLREIIEAWRASETLIPMGNW